MSDTDIGIIIALCFCLLFLGLVAGYFSGHDDGLDAFEKIAIEEGYGEYYLNSDNQRQFRFKNKSN